MDIKAIVARSENNVIGKNNSIPWHYSKDLKHFKQSTMGDTLVMGRRTYESPGTYPGREVIVVTSTKDYDHVKTVDSPDDAIDKANNTSIWICGGNSIYDHFMGEVDEIVVSEIPVNIDNGDTFFPEIPEYYEKYKTEDKGSFIIRRYKKQTIPKDVLD